MNYEIKDPFVAEVVRIIMECYPIKYGRRTLVLVSRKFYDAACIEAARIGSERFGSNATDVDSLLVCHTETIPVSWLKDYEFEIRKQ